MVTFNTEIYNDYLQSQGPIAMFKKLSLNFEINKHGLRYKIPIDPGACLGATAVCQTLNLHRTGNPFIYQL
jgi:hypothetical protein